MVQKRIAIYGGTFDPVHLAHLEIARRVLQLFEIDELLFVPAQRAPHKVEREVTLPVHRYAMLALATQKDARILVSTFELDAPDRRYTVDTLAHFQSKFGRSAELFFVMGADSWSEITMWREWERLITMANHIVVTRPGNEIDWDQVTPSVAVQIVDLRGSDQSSLSSLEKEGQARKIFVTDVVMIDISATEIRRAAREDRIDDLRKLVPLPVADYISKYKLYRNSNEA
jgi:nicotinate (nicotinamide) nucleotide adenylyltransferase